MYLKSREVITSCICTPLSNFDNNIYYKGTVTMICGRAPCVRGPGFDSRLSLTIDFKLVVEATL